MQRQSPSMERPAVNSTFQCQVCFETCNQRLALPKLVTVNGDVIRGADCGHPVCQSCMAAFVAARVENVQVFGIYCPIQGCKKELHEQDVVKLVESGALKPEVADQLAKLRKQDYTDRLADICDDLASMRGIGSMRLCPRCCVIIQKRDGCNSFGCVCGHRFQFDSAPSLKAIEAVLSTFCEDATSKHNINRTEASKRIVVAISTKGIKRYGRVLKLAESRQLPLELAELHEQALLGQQAALQQLENARRSRNQDKIIDLLVTQLHLSLDDATAVFQKARAGDEASRQMIRQARQLRSQKKSSKVQCAQNRKLTCLYNKKLMCCYT
mmetsp:Transcript_168427/g.298526  ORF Transcript_168427/g.298526 Transcript_168427/m.298526 type:complete len:326 (-) Transcript_168427:301-1278(-)